MEVAITSTSPKKSLKTKSDQHNYDKSILNLILTFQFTKKYKCTGKKH